MDAPPAVDTEPPAKRVRPADAPSAAVAAASAAVSSAAGDAPCEFSLNDWMMSWTSTTGEGPGSDEQVPTVPTATDDEVAAFLQEEEESRAQRKVHLLAEAVKALRTELLPLVDRAASSVATAQARVAHVDALEAAGDDAISAALQEFEEASVSAQRLVSACGAYVAGEKFARVQNASGSVSGEAQELLCRARAAKRSLELAGGAAEEQRRCLKLRQGEEEKKRAALKATEESEHLFDKYDKDGDGVLHAGEAVAFVRRECNFDLSQEKISEVLRSEPFAGAGGVRKEHFSRFRLLVGAASVAGALAGVETEVQKAETKARPLSAQGRAAVPLALLEEATAELETLVEAARDYLDASREQLQCIGGAEASDALGPEAGALRALRVRNEALEGRLAQAATTARACRGRLDLQQRKAALLRGL